MLTVISNLLTALLQLLKQNHLLAKDYQSHLLYERLQDGIDQDIDRVKEIALACGYDDSIADADNSSIEASEVLDNYPDIVSIEKQIIKEINNIIATLNSTENESFDGVFNEYTAKEAIINMLGDIAEKRTRDIYLLRFGGKI